MNPDNLIEFRCETLTPRLEYVLDFIGLNTGLVFRVPGKEVEPGKGLLIDYTSKPQPDGFSIYASGFLAEKSIRSFEPEVVQEDGNTFLFPAPDGFTLPFDLFSGIFYLISRYEEYLPFKGDRYGRFEAAESMAFRNHFLEEPLVDIWLKQFVALLKEKHPAIIIPNQSFQFQPTMDVDQPWAYVNNGWLRNIKKFLGHTFRLEYRQVWDQMRTLSGRIHDCFDTYGYVEELETKYGLRCPYFFLSGNRSKFDTNFALKSLAFQNLIRTMKKDRMVGIHPSFLSNLRFSELQNEFDFFAEKLGQAPVWSRQHFLIFSMPATYRNLIKLGIEEDFSMGYASATGFRAGTSRPFKFYDLQQEEATELVIHPFVMMDVTLQQYLQMDSGQALEKTIALIHKVKSVQGVFTAIWHNESLSDRKQWAGWRSVFEGMIREGVKNINPV